MWVPAVRITAICLVLNKSTKINIKSCGDAGKTKVNLLQWCVNAVRYLLVFPASPQDCMLIVVNLLITKQLFVLELASKECTGIVERIERR